MVRGYQSEAGIRADFTECSVSQARSQEWDKGHKYPPRQKVLQFV